jgi:hypothetical protein
VVVNLSGRGIVVRSPCRLIRTGRNPDVVVGAVTDVRDCRGYGNECGEAGPGYHAGADPVPTLNLRARGGFRPVEVPGREGCSES